MLTIREITNSAQITLCRVKNYADFISGVHFCIMRTEYLVRRLETGSDLKCGSCKIFLSFTQRNTYLPKIWYTYVVENISSSHRRVSVTPGHPASLSEVDISRLFREF